MVNHTRALSALLLVIGLLSLAALACNSDQEWIIPRTDTPVPTNTPLPLSGNAEFAPGDEVRIVVNSFQLPQTTNPEPDTRNNRVIGGGCFPNTTVPVLGVAEDGEGNIYYRVTCILDGWVPAENVEAVE
ncbi:MAG: hypothetical protein JXN59_16810 [Anaerolineae bacterium]|nr:hypothetical protein [Anaerolineae bacterium]